MINKTIIGGINIMNKNISKTVNSRRHRRRIKKESIRLGGYNSTFARGVTKSIEIKFLSAITGEIETINFREGSLDLVIFLDVLVYRGEISVDYRNHICQEMNVDHIELRKYEEKIHICGRKLGEKASEEPMGIDEVEGEEDDYYSREDIEKDDQELFFNFFNKGDE